MGFHPTSRAYPRRGARGCQAKTLDFQGRSEPPPSPTRLGDSRTTLLRVDERGGAWGGRPRLLGRLVVLEGLGEPPLDLLDPGGFGRVRGQELGRPLALGRD